MCTEDEGKFRSSNDAESPESVGVIETLPGKHEAGSRFPRWLSRNRKIVAVGVAIILIFIVIIVSTVISLSKRRDHDRSKTR